ncbi:MAG: ferredoxin-NADP reductase [candidate division Zixibacteria bacterium SM23_81]|nr:MAG: ferredoxin-NADP reductase [candidate division Zixibacteria bacterium SM23_81]
MFKIIESQMVVPNMHLLVVEAPAVARQMNPGQFVILRSEEDGERIPLSVSDWDAKAGTVTVVFLNVGHSTSTLASLESGMNIPSVVGPLGNPTEIDKFGTVLCLGGCYGIGSLYPIARALKEKGNKIVTVIEARSSFLFYWEDRLREVSDQLFHITRDGTKGSRGHVSRLPEIIKAWGQSVDRMIINGCTFLLKRGSDVSRSMGIKTVVSLNPIMIDGTGMCGVCRVTVAEATKFACVDGPDFDGHEVDWAELLQRRKQYVAEESVSFRTSRCEEHARRP